MQTPPWQHGMIQNQKVLIKNQVSFNYSHIYIVHNPGLYFHNKRFRLGYFFYISVKGSSRDPRTDRSELVRDFQNFGGLGPRFENFSRSWSGPVKEFKNFLGSCSIRSQISNFFQDQDQTVRSVDPCYPVPFWWSFQGHPS